MNYYVPMEIEARDFEPRLYLAARLAATGGKVVTGEKVGVHRAMDREKGEFTYVDKGLEVRDYQWYREIIARRGKIVLLDEEGGIYPEGPIAKWLMEARSSPTVLPFVSTVCCWGLDQKEAVTARMPSYPEERIHPTGHPRFDMVKPGFAKYFSTLLNREISQKREGVLINMSFGLVNGSRFDDIEDLIAEHAPGMAEVAPVEAIGDHYRQRHEHQSKLFASMLDALQYCASKLSETQFVVRPHPVEKLDTYERAFESLANVTVRREGPAHYELSKAEVLVHFDCTTAIEAFFMGLSPISYSPDLVPELTQMLPVNISKRTVDKDELCSSIAGALSKTSTEAEDRDAAIELIRRRIGNIDHSAIDQVVELIVGADDPPTTRKFSWLWKLRHQLRLSTRSLRMRLATTTPSLGKFTPLKKSAIEKRITALREVDENVKPVEITMLEANACQLELLKP